MKRRDIHFWNCNQTQRTHQAAAIGVIVHIGRFLHHHHHPVFLSRMAGLRHIPLKCGMSDTPAFRPETAAFFGVTRKTDAFPDRLPVNKHFGWPHKTVELKLNALSVPVGRNLDRSGIDGPQFVIALKPVALPAPLAGHADLIPFGTLDLALPRIRLHVIGELPGAGELKNRIPHFFNRGRQRAQPRNFHIRKRRKCAQQKGQRDGIICVQSQGLAPYCFLLFFFPLGVSGGDGTSSLGSQVASFFFNAAYSGLLA